MKKHLGVVLSCITNFILSIFSYFYLYISITDIAGIPKGTSYEIQEPDKSAYIFIGVTMLVVYLLAGIIIQFALYKLSKLSKRKYAIYMSIIYITGLITGYFFELRS